MANDQKKERAALLSLREQGGGGWFRQDALRKPPGNLFSCLWTTSGPGFPVADPGNCCLFTASKPQQHSPSGLSCHPGSSERSFIRLPTAAKLFFPDSSVLCVHQINVPLLFSPKQVAHTGLIRAFFLWKQPAAAARC